MHECGSTLPHSPMNGGLSILLCFFGSWHQARLSHHLHLFHVTPVFCALAILEPEHVHTHHIHGFAVSGHGTPGSGVVAGHAEVHVGEVTGSAPGHGFLLEVGERGVHHGERVPGGLDAVKVMAGSNRSSLKSAVSRLSRYRPAPCMIWIRCMGGPECYRYRRQSNTTRNPRYHTS